jgi:hypothetical protein
MSFGYFSGPQTITSSTTRHVPSSPAQLLTVVIHQQDKPTSFAEAVSYTTVPFYSIVRFRNNKYLCGRYTLIKNRVSPSTVPEDMRFLVCRTTAIKYFAMYCKQSVTVINNKQNLF